MPRLIRMASLIYNIHSTVLYNKCLNIVSFNMHGFNQGILQLKSLCSVDHYDIIFVQEHWLTNDSLINFDYFKTDYKFFGISAIDSEVRRGILRGRPFGVVGTLIRRTLPGSILCIACTDRYVIVAVGSLLLINVYLPSCRSAADHELLSSIFSRIGIDLNDCTYSYAVLGGDFKL